MDVVCGQIDGCGAKVVVGNCRFPVMGCMLREAIAAEDQPGQRTTREVAQGGATGHDGIIRSGLMLSDRAKRGDEQHEGHQTVDVDKCVGCRRMQQRGAEVPPADQYAVATSEVTNTL